jgi:hypothetical protein
MSGGHFNYDQYRVTQIADEVKQLIESNNDESENEYGGTVGLFYDAAIIEKFIEAEHWLRRAAEMAQRIDWLVSGDDGPECFMRRWDKEVRKP